MAEVNPPLLIPDAVQRRAGGLGKSRREVGAAEGAEAVLLRRIDVGVARIKRCTHRAEDEVSREERLEKDVHVSEGSQAAAAVLVAVLRIELERFPAVDAVLHLKERDRVRHEIDAGDEIHELLSQRLRPVEGRGDVELREVGSDGVTGINSAEEHVRRDMTTAVARTEVGRLAVQPPPRPRSSGDRSHSR